ncbi:MAG TPA: hypothetical protein VGO21_05855 [Candidatus Paceibacterota bacterium]|jgi:DNA-binding Lrp family transcriptional regulator|nr:hypothetical protein [Candidatus Paceibacterota bacterium]
MEDIEILKKNCVEYANSHGKAVIVLKKADGKTQYSDIAKTIDIHSTTVSGLLKKAEKLGLVFKNRIGNYKKKSGVLGYMPKQNKISPKKVVQDIFKKISKAKKGRKQIPFQLIIPSNILVNLDKMSDAYRSLYAVENVLRSLIRKVFLLKNDWWKNNIPFDVQQIVGDEILKTTYHAASRKDELEYTHLGQLKKIIIWKKNWNDFLPFLNEKDKNSFSATIDKAIPSRNAVGHCIPLNTVDLRVVDVRFQDILKMIK